MAHIPNSYAPVSDKRVKTLVYEIPKGGMMLTEIENLIPDGKCGLCLNMDEESGVLLPRMGVVSSSLQIENDRALHSVTEEPFCEKLVLHMGNCLYCFGEGDTSAVLISSNLPDEKSLFCHFMSKLYIYCAGRVFCLDNGFDLTEEIPDAPVLYSGVTPAAGSVAKRIENSPINLLSPRITVEYSSSRDTVFYLPNDADITKRVIILEGTDEITEGITLSENRVVIKNPDSLDRSISISYSVKNPDEIGYDTRLYDCKNYISFGGNANGGTRIIFTGDENRKGCYYKSALQNPLLVLSDDYEIIGDGCENITSLKKMYGDLIIFTENSVFKMKYSLTSDGGFFSTKEISHGIGCDCPKSVQLIDNRVVFANSKKGVFIVSQTDDTGEHNIKPLSGNVQKGQGMGLLDNDENLIKNASSLDFDRKYMLFVGDRVYVWDYDARSFADSNSYSDSQKRLKWYLYDSLSGDDYFILGKSLVCYSNSGKNFKFYGKGSEGDLFECVFDSGTLGFSNANERKYMCELELILKKSTEGNMAIELFCDGKSFYKRDLSCKYEEKSKIKIKIPYCCGFSYAFRLACDTGFELYGANIKYKYI